MEVENGPLEDNVPLQYKGGVVRFHVSVGQSVEPSSIQTGALQTNRGILFPWAGLWTACANSRYTANEQSPAPTDRSSCTLCWCLQSSGFIMFIYT